MALQTQRLLVKSVAVFSRTQWSRILPLTSLDFITKAAVTPTVQKRFFQSHPVVFQRVLFSDLTAVQLVHQHTFHHARELSSSANNSDDQKDVSYEEMTQLIGNEEVLIIDVREPYELAQTGLIGNSINIPLGDLHSAFSLSEENFKDRYKISKPSTSDDNVVLHCLGGVRSRTGLDIVQSLGYNKVRHYPGGWEEWVEKLSQKKI